VSILINAGVASANAIIPRSCGATRVDKECRQAPTEPPPRGNARALPTCRHHGSVAPIKREK